MLKKKNSKLVIIFMKKKKRMNVLLNKKISYKYSIRIFLI